MQNDNEKLTYSVWGVRAPHSETSDGIYSSCMYNTWVYIKEGGPNRRSLSGIDHKLYSQLEVRDSAGKTIITVMLDN